MRYGPLMTKDGARQFEVTHAREAKTHLVATLQGIASRQDAERLNGVELYVARKCCRPPMKTNFTTPI